jgi:photosystem II stability/assembly factor-like uncharacterized protein
MNTTLRLICALLFTTQQLNAQWTTLNSGITDAITSISVPSADSVYAVSTDFFNGGKIIASHNGSTFTTQYSSPNYLLTVHFNSGTLGWAGGGIIPNGIILKTTNGGQTWTTQTTAVHQIYSIDFINDTLGWAIGNDASQGNFYIYHTTDGGNNWSQQHTGFDYLRAIKFTSDSIGYAVGDNGRILKTTDAGQNWSLLTTGVVFHFNDLSFINDSTGWANGSYITGGCYSTSDAGNNWNAQTLPTTTPVSSVHFLNAQQGWQAGENGKIYFTANGGNSWTTQNSSTTSNLSCLRMYNQQTGYAAGAGGTLLKYENASSSIDELPSRSISIFPNPSSDYISLTFPYERETTPYTITDETGRIILKGILDKSLSTIDISDLPAGMYLLQTSDNGRAASFVCY